MSEKYLPIGTICTLKGKQKKVMITGYYATEFNGNFKINDYEGCVYPEGFLLPNLACTFNHSDIEKFDFIGYKNEEFDKFNSLLNKLAGNVDSTVSEEQVLTSSSSYSKLIFDENGVVILAEPAIKSNPVQSNEVKQAQEIKLNNPFKKEYSNEVGPNSNNDNNIFEENKVEDSNNNGSNTIYKFDENGFVIAVEENTATSNQVVEDTRESEPIYRFDENGTLIAVEENTATSNEIVEDTRGSEPIYRFDENGTLIAVEENTATSNPVVEDTRGSEPIYRFDENGTLIAVEENTATSNEIVEDTRGSEPIYRFDENGTLIAVE